MALVVISIDRSKLPQHTNEQFTEWLLYRLYQDGYISHDNPLLCRKLVAEIKEIGQ